MTDDRCAPDAGDFVRFTPEQHRQILNLLDVVGELQRFSTDDKQALARLIADQPHLHAMVEARQFALKMRVHAARFFKQFAGVIAFLAGLNEFWKIVEMWRSHKP